MKKQTIELRFLPDQFLKLGKDSFVLLSMIRAILPNDNVGLPKSGNPTLYINPEQKPKKK